MRVIGAGFGRTGTTSTRAALELLLGAPCYHMEVVMQRPDHLAAWRRLATGEVERMDWPALLSGFGAALDFPVCAHYRELMDAFPDAIVLLTVRDPEAWWASLEKLSGTRTQIQLAARFLPRARDLLTVVDALVFEAVFGGELTRERAIETYLAHNQAVRESVPPGRLLEFRVTDGWAPLCEALSLPEPDAPFPHLASGTGRVRRLIQRLFGAG